MAAFINPESPGLNLIENLSHDRWEIINVPARGGFAFSPERRRPLEPATIMRPRGFDAELLAAIRLSSENENYSIDFWLLRMTERGRKTGAFKQLSQLVQLKGKFSDTTDMLLLDSLDGESRGLIVSRGDIIHFGNSEYSTRHFELPAELESIHSTLYCNLQGTIALINKTPRADALRVAVGTRFRSASSPT